MEDNESRLFEAIKIKNSKLVTSLIENGVNLKARNNEGMNALHLAVKERCSLQLLQKLLNADRDIVNELVSSAEEDANEKDGYSSLHFCAEHMFTDITQLLLLHGANVNVVGRNKKTPLHIAASSASVELEQFVRNNSVMKVLLQAGANADKLDENHDLPITIGIKHDHVAIVKLLLNYSNVNQYRDLSGRTVMHLAAERYDTEIINDLVSAGVDVCVKDASGNTPICNPIQRKSYIYKHLLKIGFDLDRLSDTYSFSYSWEFFLRAEISYLVKLYFIEHRFLKQYFVIIHDKIKSSIEACTPVHIEAKRIFKTLIPGTDILFADIIKSDEKKLATFAGNEHVLQVFDDQPALKIQWPYYWSILNARMTKGWVRWRLLQKCQKIFQSGILNPHILPYYPIRNILNHLETHQLHAFIVAFPAVDSSEFDDLWFLPRH